MAPVARLAVAVWLLLGSAAHADPVARWRPFVDAASVRFGVPARWIEAVMRAESGGHLTLAGRPITSAAGAMGLMQLMPATWSDMRTSLALGNDPFDPHDNIVAGTAYLRQMYDRFGYPGLFAAYNAGPARYAASLATGTPLPRETRAYLAAVGVSGSVVDRPVGPATDRLFAVRHMPGIGTQQRQAESAPGDMFVVLPARR